MPIFVHLEAYYIILISVLKNSFLLPGTGKQVIFGKLSRRVFLPKFHASRSHHPIQQKIKGQMNQKLKAAKWRMNLEKARIKAKEREKERAKAYLARTRLQLSCKLKD